MTDKKDWLEEGFIVEVQGEAKIEITNRTPYEMFWSSYTVTYLVDNEDELKAMQEPGYWEEAKFYSIALGGYIDSAFVGRPPFDAQGRLKVRAEIYEDNLVKD